jgi:hypothetical protein
MGSDVFTFVQFWVLELISFLYKLPTYTLAGPIALASSVTGGDIDHAARGQPAQ